MSTHKLPGIVLAFGLASSAAFSAGPNLGTPLEPAEIAAWDISIQPDGTGLPVGGGTPAQGARIFAQKCALCHGENGKGGAFAALVGGAPLTGGIDTPKTIANFWGYSTTAFDFIRRSMLWQQPRSLTDDAVYALSACLLPPHTLTAANDAR